MKHQKILVSPLEQKRRLPKWEAFKLLHQDAIRDFYKEHPRHVELPVRWDDVAKDYVWFGRKLRRQLGIQFEKRIDFTWKNYLKELWKIIKLQVKQWFEK